MKAAVLYEFKKPMVIEDVTLDSPAKGEVKVKMAATAICASDIHLISGEFPGMPLPLIAGHESAGYVEEVGEGVTSVKPGDHVVVTTVVSCGECQACLNGYPHLCELRRKTNVGGHIHNKKGQGIITMDMVAGFAEYTNINACQVVKIPNDFPLDIASLLSCGVITGFGAVVNRAQVKPLSSVVVIGTGGVGLSAIQGAAISGAYPVIAVDILDNKLEAAKKFGATHIINSKREDAVKAVKNITGGWGTNYSFTTIANNAAIHQAVDMLGKRGTAVIIGVPHAGETFAFSSFELMDDEKTLTAVYMGSTHLHVDIPRLVALYKARRFKLDELVSKRYPFDKINEAIDSMVKGESLRNVLIF